MSCDYVSVVVTTVLYKESYNGMNLFIFSIVLSQLGPIAPVLKVTRDEELQRKKFMFQTIRYLDWLVSLDFLLQALLILVLVYHISNIRSIAAHLIWCFLNISMGKYTYLINLKMWTLFRYVKRRFKYNKVKKFFLLNNFD